MTSSKWACRLAGLLLMLFSIIAYAQTQTVRLIVGFPAGGAPDTIARVLVQHLEKAQGVTIVVENRPGASGQISIDTLLGAPSDGRTMALIPSSILALLPAVVKTARFDPQADFIALGSVAEYGFGLAAGPASSAADLKQYQEWVKDNEQRSSFATPGLGTPQHFLGEQLKSLLGIELLHVPYRGGAAAMSDVLGGLVPLLFTTEQLLVPYEQDGRLKTLFITSAQRNPLMPEVPTAKEIGLEQLETTDWFGVFIRSGTDTESVKQWQAAIRDVVESEEYRNELSKLGYIAPKKQYPDFKEQMATERQVWDERIELSGFAALD